MCITLEQIAAIGGAIAFLVGFFQWIDVRRREERSRRYDQFHRAFEWIAGRTAEGKPLVDTQQAMAVYEIAEFREYSEVSLPIIEYYLKKTEKEPDDSLFRAALLHSRRILTRAK